MISGESFRSVSSQVVSSQAAEPVQNALTFPLQRGGGAFLVCVGLGILVGCLAARLANRKYLLYGLIGGAALGVIVMAVGGATKIIFDGIGYPAWWQWAFLGLGVLVEGYLVNLVVEKNPDRTGKQFWLWMLFVVGVHFLVLTGSHGPICGILGLLCMINAWIGLQSKTPDYLRFWAIDGALKVAAGATMLALSY